MKRRRGRRHSPEISVTSFCVCPVRDEYISEELLVMLVDNIADDQQQSWGPTKNRKGKPSGIGMPGGGQEYLETREEAAAGELRRETGFEALSLKELYQDRSKLIIARGNNTRNRISFDPDDNGRLPPHRLGPGEHRIINSIYVFSAKIDYSSSQLKEIIHKKIAEYPGSRELLLEELRSVGAWIRLDELDTPTLDISEDKEIDMVGLFPLSFLQKVYNSRILQDSFEEFYGYRFYYSHLQRIGWAALMMGLPWDITESLIRNAPKNVREKLGFPQP